MVQLAFVVQQEYEQESNVYSTCPTKTILQQEGCHDMPVCEQILDLFVSCIAPRQPQHIHVLLDTLQLHFNCSKEVS